MPPLTSRFALGLLACAAAASVQAQTAPAPAAASVAAPAPPAASTPAPSGGLLNDFLRNQEAGFRDWDIGGQVRGRFEAKSGFAVAGVAGAVDFSDLTPDNNYWLLREKVHVGWKPVSWLNLFAEGRNSNTWEDRRTPAPEE